jgi:hypothetical protein
LQHFVSSLQHFVFSFSFSSFAGSGSTAKFFFSFALASYLKDVGVAETSTLPVGSHLSAGGKLQKLQGRGEVGRREEGRFKRHRTVEAYVRVCGPSCKGLQAFVAG